MEKDNSNFAHVHHNITVGEYVAHQFHHLEAIPHKVAHMLSIGIVKISDPHTYIEEQQQKILDELVILQQVDPSVLYHSEYLGLPAFD